MEVLLASLPHQEFDAMEFNNLVVVKSSTGTTKIHPLSSLTNFDNWKEYQKLFWSTTNLNSSTQIEIMK